MKLSLKIIVGMILLLHLAGVKSKTTLIVFNAAAVKTITDLLLIGKSTGNILPMHENFLAKIRVKAFQSPFFLSPEITIVTNSRSFLQPKIIKGHSKNQLSLFILDIPPPMVS